MNNNVFCTVCDFEWNEPSDEEVVDCPQCKLQAAEATVKELRALLKECHDKCLFPNAGNLYERIETALKGESSETT